MTPRASARRLVFIIVLLGAVLAGYAAAQRMLDRLVPRVLIVPDETTYASITFKDDAGRCYAYDLEAADCDA